MPLSRFKEQKFLILLIIRVLKQRTDNAKRCHFLSFDYIAKVNNNFVFP